VTLFVQRIIRIEAMQEKRRIEISQLVHLASVTFRRNSINTQALEIMWNVSGSLVEWPSAAGMELCTPSCKPPTYRAASCGEKATALFQQESRE